MRLRQDKLYWLLGALCYLLAGDPQVEAQVDDGAVTTVADSVEDVALVVKTPDNGDAAVAGKKLRLRRSLDAAVMGEQFWDELVATLAEHCPPGTDLQERPAWLTLEGCKARLADRDIPARLRRHELGTWRGIAALFRLRATKEASEHELLREFVEEALIAANQVILVRFSGAEVAPAFVRKSREALVAAGAVPEDGAAVRAEIAALKDARRCIDEASQKGRVPFPRHPAEV